MLWRLIVQAERTGADAVVFEDTFAPNGISDALNDTGFVAAGQIWTKPLIRGTVTLGDLPSELDAREGAGTLPQPVAERLRYLAKRDAAESVGELERIIWPGILVGAGVRCYIVPIQRRWATPLFDVQAAAEDLFPPDASRLLRFESAYYRAAKPRVIANGYGRILWYVSDQEGDRLSKQIRASSLVRTLHVDIPKNVFRRYRRFGVFEWEAVSALGRRGNGASMMGFSFSHTATLKRPVPFTVAQDLLKDRLGRLHTFQSPVEVPEQTWLELLARGTEN